MQRIEMLTVIYCISDSLVHSGEFLTQVSLKVSSQRRDQLTAERPRRTVSQELRSTAACCMADRRFPLVLHTEAPCGKSRYYRPSSFYRLVFIFHNIITDGLKPKVDEMISQKLNGKIKCLFDRL